MTNIIYLDYAATTPVDTRVAEKMTQYLTQQGNFGNPASLHILGANARDAIDLARQQVADYLCAESREIIWTSGATESNNLAIKGAAQLQSHKGKHIVTMKTEHKAVLDPCQHLEKYGFQVTYLSPDKNGLLNIDEFKSVLRKDTILVSIMIVNNETGVIQDIQKIAEITAENNILLHVDAAQAPGKITMDVQQTPIHLMSLCAHKVYGPKGIGALYLRKKPRVRVEPLLHGGGHEQGMRSGTLPTHQIVGMGEAFALAKQELTKDIMHVTTLRDIFLSLLKTNPYMKLNVSLDQCVPHILNVRFDNMLADALLKQLPFIAASTASACTGKSAEGSHVLRAMGFDLNQIKSAVRFSFGRMTTIDEVKTAANMIQALFR